MIKENYPKLFGLNYTDIDIKRCIEQNEILRLSLELTSKCNLACNYCFKEVEKKERKTLLLTDYKDIILQGKDLGCKTVVFPGDGEPTLDENFEELISFNDQNDLNTVVFTNGIRLVHNENLLNYIGSKNTSLILKLNSLDEELHNSIVKYDHYHIIKELLNHNTINRMKSENKIGLHSIISNINKNEIIDLWQFCRDQNIIPLFEVFAPILSVEDNNYHTLDKIEIKEIFSDLLNIDRKIYGFNWRPKSPFPAGSCDKFYTNIYVNNRGDINPCIGIPDITFGNAKKNLLKEIMIDSKFQKLRNIKSKLEGKCANCKDEYCYGCRAVAYQLEKNIFEEYPFCCK